MDLVSILAQTTTLYTTTDTTTSSGPGALLIILYFAVVVLMIAAMWKMFTKAGEEGWKSIIPLYNSYTLFRIAGRNGWGFLLAAVPLVNLVVLIMVSLDLGKHFGKDTGWSVFMLVLFPFVGYPMLGFGDDKYVGIKHD